MSWIDQIPSNWIHVHGYFNFYVIANAMILDRLRGGPLREIQTEYQLKGARTYKLGFDEDNVVKDFLGTFDKELGEVRFRCQNTDGLMFAYDTFVINFSVYKKSFSVDVLSTAPEQRKLVEDWLDLVSTNEPPQGSVYVMVQTKEGLAFKRLDVAGEKLLRDNYTHEVLTGYDKIIKDLNDPSPLGRVAIFNGTPGTGKTYLVRGLINETQKSTLVLAPPNLIAHLAQPDMIPTLIELHEENEGKPIVFLVEDADEILAKRAGDNMSSITAVLNLSDGILGKLLDVRLVCTTNATHADLDPAILRPGRLSAHVHVDAVDGGFANMILDRLQRERQTQILPLEHGRKYTLAEIYLHANSGSTDPITPVSRKMGFR